MNVTNYSMVNNGCPARAAEKNANFHSGDLHLHLYGEESLQLPEALGRHGDAPGILGHLIHAGSADARGRLVRGMLHEMGFEWLGYGSVSHIRGRSLPLSFFTSYAHQTWVRRYFSQHHYDIDTRCAEDPVSTIPTLWDIDHLAASLSSPDPGDRGRRFVEDLHNYGIRSGMVFRTVTPRQPHEHIVISMTSSIAKRDWISDSVVGRALLLGLSLHEFLSRHARISPLRDEMAGAPSNAVTAPMSSMQKCILEHLLQGRSDKEIAHRLHVTAHTVDYHMRQLRRRFAARNRVQIVNAAKRAMDGERDDIGALHSTPE